MSTSDQPADAAWEHEKTAHHIASQWCRTPDDFYEAKAAIAAALADTERAKDEELRAEIARLKAELREWEDDAINPAQQLQAQTMAHTAGFREGIEAVAKAFENMPAVAAAIRAIEQSERALQPPENQPGYEVREDCDGQTHHFPRR